MHPTAQTWLKADISRTKNQGVSILFLKAFSIVAKWTFNKGTKEYCTISVHLCISSELRFSQPEIKLQHLLWKYFRNCIWTQITFIFTLGAEPDILKPDNFYWAANPICFIFTLVAEPDNLYYHKVELLCWHNMKSKKEWRLIFEGQTWQNAMFVKNTNLPLHKEKKGGVGFDTTWITQTGGVSTKIEDETTLNWVLMLDMSSAGVKISSQNATQHSKESPFLQNAPFER